MPKYYFKARFYSGLGLILAAFVAIAVFYGLYQTKNAVEAEQASWIEYSAQEMRLSGTLDELQQTIGFGGFIHNFKNYILRQEAHYADAAQAKITLSYSLIAQLEPFYTEPEGRRALGAIQQTIEEYERNLSVARQTVDQANGNVTSLHALDAAVRVDDSAAIQELTTLRFLSMARLAEQEKNSLILVNQTQETLNLFMLLGVLIAITGFILVYIFNKSIDLTKDLGAAIEQLNHLVDDHPDGILVVDDNGHILEINQQISKMFGYRKRELIGEPIEFLIPIESRDKHHGLQQAYFKTGERREMSASAKIFGLAKDGKKVPLQIGLNRVSYGKGFAVIAACKDLTPVIERSQQLEQAMKAANSAAEARSRFLAVMSHELRTPLNGIIGFSELMQMNLSSGEKMDLAKLQVFSKQVTRSGRHLLDIVNEVLDFAGLEHGGVKLKSEPVNVLAVIQNLKSMTTFQCDEANVRLTIDCAPDLPKCVMTDKRRLNQVFLNLIGNATKFAPDSEVKISVKHDVIGINKVRFIAAISDSGPGIEKASLESIFSPFEQVEENKSRKNEGTGLGLAITKSIVEAMQGRIWVESEKGKGTTFHFTIEAEDISSIYESIAPELQARESAVKLIEGLRLLVVDDLQVNAHAVRSVLEPLGVKITWAESGEIAVDLMGKMTFDLILMDLHMPGMDGYDTAMKIKEKMEATASCPPIYAWSADVLHDFQKDIPTLWEGVLSKPTMPNDIVDLLQKQKTVH